MSTLTVHEAETVIDEETRVEHRLVGTDEILTVGPVTFWVENTIARECVQQNLIREWVLNGWGQDIAEMLADEMAKDPGTPAPFDALPGGGS